jgi:cellulose synthase/poly-beta-1,6-N-acetylglucosamine synthase-like glycosyltransferase
MNTVIQFVQWFFLIYVIAIHTVYLSLNIISFLFILRYQKFKMLKSLPQIYSGLEPPVSILVPAFNEEMTIISTVESLMQLTYPEYEVIIINDGSRDGTLEILRQELELISVHENIDSSIPTQSIQRIYKSKKYPNIKVVDKINGGKADSLNAGLFMSQYPYICCIDADSILQRNSLDLVMQELIDCADAVAAGGTVRIANGCHVEDGYLVDIGIPSSKLALFQVMEYLRAFLFGRMGWSPLNALLVISGAFGVFKKDIVIECGGFDRSSVSEDMELVVRLHKNLLLGKKPYRISFIPDPICWTEAPENVSVLMNQRIRWQRGLTETLGKNLKLLCHPRGLAVSWIAFPYMVFVELLSPIVEVFGYVFFFFAWMFGILSVQAALAFLMATIFMGLLLSTNALFLEELSFHLYPRIGDRIKLFLAAIFENLGYRQINVFWRFWAVIKFILGRNQSWGVMKRQGSWQK